MNRSKQTYRRLHKDDRHVIYQMRKEGNTQSVIARTIGFSQSTICKELSRNKGLRGYRPAQAQRKAEGKQSSKKTRSCVLTGKILNEVEGRLRTRHSPEQISLRLASEHAQPVLSHQTIYNYIAKDKKEGGHLYSYLRINSRRRYRHKNKANRSKIPKRRGIEERPLSVDQRLDYGDWEGDLICGKSGSGYIVSLLERKSRHCLLAYVQDKKSELVSEAIIKMLQPFSAKSLTVDNGLEFASHQKIQKELGVCVYFCRPYSSHEKGSVENLNGLVRQYYPKGSSFQNVEASLSKVEEEINDRPRKILNLQTPNELKHLIAA